jgi:hypothetical protein
MKRILELTVGMTLLMLPSAWAGTVPTSIPINATTVSSCVIVITSSNASIDLNASQQYTASGSYSGADGFVTTSVYCNKLTPLTQRSVTGVTTTTTFGEANAVDVVLAKFFPTANGDTIKVRAWFTNGTVAPSSDPGFVGATRYRQNVAAGWKNGQWGASSGQYAGSVQFSVTF